VKGSNPVTCKSGRSLRSLRNYPPSVICFMSGSGQGSKHPPTTDIAQTRHTTRPRHGATTRPTQGDPPDPVDPAYDRTTPKDNAQGSTDHNHPKQERPDRTTQHDRHDHTRSTNRGADSNGLFFWDSSPFGGESGAWREPACCWMPPSAGRSLPAISAEARPHAARSSGSRHGAQGRLWS
jgi:hypothetical protein